MKYLFALTLLLPSICLAQINFAEDDVRIGGDIFSDFNEDLEASQVMEDERFYRYSRFFGVNLGLGVTTFTGNRGSAYTDQNPSFALTLMYFINFQSVFIMGFEFSKHFFVVDTAVNGYPDEIPGTVTSSLLRPFFGYRYYLDTQDLGTALTYSNPYIVGRVEYWYQTQKFIDRDNLSDKKGGGLGAGFGFGLEFPVELKKSYFNVEFLYHFVNFNDKFTQEFANIPNPTPDEQTRIPADRQFPGFNNLAGDVLTFFASYNFSW